MTSIIESLLAVFKDFHWLVSIDTLLIFFVNYLMFHAAGRVKISWWLLLLSSTRRSARARQRRTCGREPRGRRQRSPAHPPRACRRLRRTP